MQVNPLSVVVCLAAFSIAAPPSEARSSSPVAYTRDTELSMALEESWDALAEGKRPAAFYRLCRIGLDGDDEGMVDNGDGRFLRVPLFVRVRLGAMRNRAKASWRSFAEPEARGAASSLRSPPDRAGLQEILRRFPNTLTASAAALWLADLHLEAGDFEDCLEVLEHALSWDPDSALRAKLRKRSDFVRSRLGLGPPPPRWDRLRENARDAIRLSAAFGRPLGKSPRGGKPPPPGGRVRFVMNRHALFLVEPHRVVEIPISRRGTPAPPLAHRRYAGTIRHAFADDRIVLLATAVEVYPWILPSGGRGKPTNAVFALEPGRRGILWIARPTLLTGSASHSPVFVSGAHRQGNEVEAVVARRTAGGAEECFLLRMELLSGRVKEETFLLVRPPRGSGKDKLEAPDFTWTLLPAGKRLFACDGRGVLLCLEGGRLRWIRTYSTVTPPFPSNTPWSCTLLAVAGRLLAAPPGAQRLIALQARDGDLLGSRAHPPIRHLVLGEGGDVWIQGEEGIALVNAGDPRLVPLVGGRIRESSAGDGFSFGSLLAVPLRGRWLLFGSSGIFLKPLVLPGPTTAVAIRDGVLYRVRPASVASFSIPVTQADFALGALPYINDAPPGPAKILLLPWLESEDPVLRRWAADLLRERVGIDFDPDAPADERRKAVERLKESQGKKD